MLQKIKIYSCAPLLKIIFYLVIIATITSCDIIKDTFDTTYLGEIKNKDRLPGKRISILEQQQSIEQLILVQDILQVIQ